MSSPAPAPAPETSTPRLALRHWLITGSIVAIGLVVAVVGVLGVTAPLPGTKITTQELAALVSDGSVAQAVAYGRDISVTTTSGELVTATMSPLGVDALAGILADQGVLLGAGDPGITGRVLGSPLPPFGLPLWVVLPPLALLIAAGYQYAVRSQAKIAGRNTELMAEQKSAAIGTAGVHVEQRPDVRLSDVIGCDEVVEEVTELVDHLHDPGAFTAVGATMPTGALLVGPPGTGKTMLARAVAGEADAAYFHASGSDFVELFVGVGSSRIRDLFAAARNCERAVIFIDEIDAVGRARGGFEASGGMREHDNTLNALLVEMDGFTESDNVLVLAATNRPDVLDPALLRPGRFDRKMFVPPPDRAGRAEMLRRFLADKPCDGVDIEVMSRRTASMTGADLSALVNEAAIRTARRGGEVITHNDMAEALRVVHAGRERNSSSRHVDDTTVVAWHEAGHAVSALLTPAAQQPDEVSIVARGMAGGMTWMQPRDQMLTLSAARADLVVLMGGRAAEELLLDGDYTTGAQGDLQSATDLAERMVYELGMNKTLAVHNRQGIRLPDSSLDGAVEELLVEALATARQLLTGRQAAVRAVAEQLIEHERIDAEQLAVVVADH